jgi:rare lipoprotein A
MVPKRVGGVIVRKVFSSVIVASIFLLGAETAGAAAVAAKKKAQSKTPALSGLASVYAYKKRSRSASGEILNFNRLVAAHRTLRFGTRVRVTNRRNGRSVVVRIIDRGPFIRGRVIDLSPAAAREIGLGWGLAPVTLAVVAHKA